MNRKFYKGMLVSVVFMMAMPGLGVVNERAKIMKQVLLAKIMVIIGLLIMVKNHAHLYHRMGALAEE